MQKIKKYLLLLAGIMLVAVISGCGGNYAVVDENKPVPITKPSGLPTNPKILIAYFSHSGNTELAAWQVQAAVGGELLAIKTAEPYPKDGQACGVIAKQELAENKRPLLAANLSDISRYETIFLGYPIWYKQAPLAVRTFLEANDFSGKVILPFCTSGSDGIEQSLAAIRESAAQADMTTGLALHDIGNGKMQRLITSWLEGVRGEVDAFNKKRASDK